MFEPIPEKGSGFEHHTPAIRRVNRFVAVGVYASGIPHRLFVAAAYHICAGRHHSGQWSKGHAKLSQLSRISLIPARWLRRRRKRAVMSAIMQRCCWKTPAEIRLTR